MRFKKCRFAVSIPSKFKRAGFSPKLNFCGAKKKDLSEILPTYSLSQIYILEGKHFSDWCE